MTTATTPAADKLLKLFEALQRHSGYTYDKTYQTIRDTECSMQVARIVRIGGQDKLGWYSQALNRRDGMSFKEMSIDALVVELLERRVLKRNAENQRQLRRDREISVMALVREFEVRFNGQTGLEVNQRRVKDLPVLVQTSSTPSHREDGTIVHPFHLDVILRGSGARVAVPAVFHFEGDTDVVREVVGITRSGDHLPYNQFLAETAAKLQAFIDSL